jgi:hypothetical protein
VRALNAEMIEMAFEDKFVVMDEANIRYGVLMELLNKVNSENPYALMPLEFVRIVTRFEESYKISNSFDFLKGLKNYSKQLNIPGEFIPQLEEILNKDVIGQYENNFDQYRKYLR